MSRRRAGATLYTPRMYRPYTPRYTPQGVRGMGSLADWWSGADSWGMAPEEYRDRVQHTYEYGRNRGLIMGASAVGILWVGAIGVYYWMNR